MRRPVVVLLLLFICFSVKGLDISDFYDSTSDISDFFQDPNAGLTTFPILLIPLGGRFESLGTAYTAVADDSGYLEANPSASSVLNFTELSFLHNNWIADSRIEGVVYTMRFNDLGIGFGGKFLYVPFTEYDFWGERESGGSGYYSESVATANISYNFFSSYYFYGLAVGANVKIAYRNIPESILPGQSALAALFDFGTLTRFNFLKFFSSRSRNFSLGAVLKNLGPMVMDEPLPTMVTLGLAYSPLRPLTISYDLNLPISYGQANEEINMAGGLEVAFTDFFAVQGGFHYRGSNPRISLGGTIDFARISLNVNYTLDLTSQAKPFDRFSVEAKLNLGDQGRLALRLKVDEYYLAGLKAFSEGDLETAIQNWEEALELDPQFAPAREFLQEALRQLENREKLRTLR